MDEFMKMLAMAVKDGKVHVVHIGDEPKKDVKHDIFAKAEKEAAEIAKMNRILYEAHIEAGFTSEEALALVVAQNN